MGLDYYIYPLKQTPNAHGGFGYEATERIDLWRDSDVLTFDFFDGLTSYDWLGDFDSLKLGDAFLDRICGKGHPDHQWKYHCGRDIYPIAHAGALAEKFKTLEEQQPQFERVFALDPDSLVMVERS